MKVFKSTKKMVILAVLGALSAILMLLEIPYPPFPFLRLDISDLPALLVAQTLGVGPAILVAIFSSLVSLMTRGIRSPFGIGLITAAISSSAVAVFYVWTKKWFPSPANATRGKKFKTHALRWTVFLAMYSLLMTVLNFLFITPIFLGGIWFTDIVGTPEIGWLSPIGADWNSPLLAYTVIVMVIYIPFNVLKGVIVLALYEIIQPRLMPQLQKVLNLRQ